MKAFILIYILLVSTVFGGAKLYSTRDYDGVKLQWQPTTWADDLNGFVLKRRLIVGSDGLAAGTWIALHPGVLRPSVDYARDWSTLGFNSNQRHAISAQIKDKKLDARQPVSADQLAEMLRRAKRFQAGDGIAMMRDATHAFAWGMGYIDNTIKSDSDCEYGLFEVNLAGVESPDPVATSRPFNPMQRKDWRKLTGLEISPQITPSMIMMRWRMPVVQAESMAVAYFILERRGDAEIEWRLLKGEVPYSIRKQTEARWNAMDKVPPELIGHPVHYRITPVDMFQAKMPAEEYTVASLTPDPLDSAKYGPAKLVAAKSADKLQIQWEQTATQWRDSTLVGFRIRKNFDFTSTFELWPASIRKAEIERSKLSAGTEYKLDAVYVNWDDVESTVESVAVIAVEAVP